ncbi:MAG TPA: MerR family transcriptional regulator [Planctomycetes bacterium]|nr:MerR family transcriptional regulator [Planctomycetota bacterium]
MSEHAYHRIGEVARIARVTVRTLHHYDQIGLLSPGMRARGDSRLYTRSDIERLFQIRLYAALGVPLREVRRILDDEGFSKAETLARHREVLEQEIARYRARIHTIDRLLEDQDDMSAEELFEGFESEELEREAERRWGETPQWAEAKARTKSYDKAQLAEIKKESHEILASFGELLRAGEAATSEEAVELAETYRMHIDRWFYPLSREAHVQLGELYVTDTRFQQVFESIAPGLAAFVQAAIEANSRRG